MASYSRRSDSEEEGNSAVAAAGCLVIGAILFINAPGMALMGIIGEAFSLMLDTGQIWTYSVLISVAVLVLLYAIMRDMGKAVSFYCLGCALLMAIFLVSHFGLKLDFPARFINYYFPGLISK